IQRDIEDNLSERILFNELKPGQIVVIDCEGDPDDVDNSQLVMRGTEQPVATVPTTAGAQGEQG
ncbi:hypothetical protein AB0I07_20240, partial [Polymorphospora rubra]